VRAWFGGPRAARSRVQVEATQLRRERARKPPCTYVAAHARPCGPADSPAAGPAAPLVTSRSRRPHARFRRRAPPRLRSAQSGRPACGAVGAARGSQSARGGAHHRSSCSTEGLATAAGHRVFGVRAPLTCARCRRPAAGAPCRRRVAAAAPPAAPPLPSRPPRLKVAVRVPHAAYGAAWLQRVVRTRALITESDPRALL
jgi:hypothetical protein